MTDEEDKYLYTRLVEKYPHPINDRADTARAAETDVHLVLSRVFPKVSLEERLDLVDALTALISAVSAL